MKREAEKDLPGNLGKFIWRHPTDRILPKKKKKSFEQHSIINSYDSIMSFFRARRKRIT